MHDNPAIYPTLPPRSVDAEVFTAIVGPNIGTIWQTCWEYVMTHELTQREGAAFWTGANLIYEATRAARAVMGGES